MNFQEAYDIAKASENTASPLPMYKCHKEVWALTIKDILMAPKPTIKELDDILNEKEEATLQEKKLSEIVAFIVPQEHFAPLAVTRDWFHKHTPEVGGYLVFYKDGYSSFSPKIAFEEGYTKV